MGLGFKTPPVELVAARQLFGLRLGLVERLEEVAERTARHCQRPSARGRQEPTSARRVCILFTFLSPPGR